MAAEWTTKPAGPVDPVDAAQAAVVSPVLDDPANIAEVQEMLAMTPEEIDALFSR